jgi:flagellar secretion chaperone FliS
LKNARAAYHEVAARGATPVGLVILLYEQAIQDLQRALVAIRDNNVEQRTREVNHALMVVGHLQGTLDLKNGGQIASNLNDFYERFKKNIMTAQAQVSPEMIRKQITDLLEIREAWVEVDRVLAERERQSGGESRAASAKWTV